MKCKFCKKEVSEKVLATHIERCKKNPKNKKVKGGNVKRVQGTVADNEQ